MLPYELQLNQKNITANALWYYQQARLRGWVNQKLRRAPKLHALNPQHSTEQYFAGMRPVAIARIQGTEGRVQDFDGHFNR